MRDKLFIKLDDKMPLYSRYAYCDAEPKEAGKIFRRLKISAVQERSFAKNGVDYTIELCRVRKKDAPKFELAMNELRNVMLLTGHADYERVVTELLDWLESGE